MAEKRGEKQVSPRTLPCSAYFFYRMIAVSDIIPGKGKNIKAFYESSYPFPDSEPLQGRLVKSFFYFTGDILEGIIYMYTSPSGKSYVGQTWCQKTRTKQHKEARTTSCFHKAIRKYGFESFKYEILHKKIYIQMELDILESSEIENRKTLVPFGYNLMISGRGGLLSEEHKRRIGAGNKGHKMPETTKNILIKANTGRKQTKEHIEKVANKNRGRKRTKEFCEGQSIRALGRKLGPMSEANKQKLRGRKMSEAQKELLIKINTGKKISEEQKEKTRESNRKRVWKNESKQKLIMIFSKNVECVETGKIYLNCKTAAKENGFKHGSAINKCAQGKMLTSYGFHWRYVK